MPISPSLIIDTESTSDLKSYISGLTKIPYYLGLTPGESVDTGNVVEKTTNFSSAMLDYARSVFSYIDPLIDIDFIETTNSSQAKIKLYAVNSFSPSSETGSDTVGYAISRPTNADFVAFWLNTNDMSSDMNTIVHEIGHTLGIGHPGVGLVPSNENPTDPSYSTDDTVMSYNIGKLGWADKFTSSDVLALQQIWGKEIDTNYGTATFSISGQGTVGSQLSIIKINDDPEGNGKFTYQWQLSEDGTNWTSIGTNSSLYTVSASDASKQIRSQITYVDGKSFSESVATSATKINAVATAKVSAADFTALASINISLPTYTMSTNWNIDKYYYYVEQYPMTLRTAFYADFVAGRATNEALWGQNHYLLYGQAEGRALPDTTGILTDSNDYGAYVENYGTTLLDIYRKDPRAVLNGGTMSMFAWGKEHYTNWGKTEGREITGGVDWGAIVRNNLDLYNKWQDAKIVTPTISAFAYGFQNQSTIKSSQNVFVGSDNSDKLTGSIVYGLNANDVVCSSGGTGILAGGFGDDLLVAANGGSDTAFGGPGSDVFQLNAGSSLNIRDFRKGADMIQLGASLSSSSMKLQWAGEENTTYFYNGSTMIAKVYGKTPTDFTYADSSSGLNKVYI